VNLAIAQPLRFVCSAEAVTSAIGARLCTGRVPRNRVFASLGTLCGLSVSAKSSQIATERTVNNASHKNPPSSQRLPQKSTLRQRGTRAEAAHGSFLEGHDGEKEIVDVLGDVPTGIYVDATLGGAGHATALLERREDMSLIGIDRDPVARAAAEERLSRFGERATVVAGRFDAIADLVASCHPSAPVTGVLFDLGVSSPQFDDAERGFSYRFEAPLDMRMNPDDPRTAADIVNTWSHQDLTRLLRDAADERFASRIAARLIDNRPIATTTELAEIVTAAIPAATRRTGGHPAKRTFQALRIAVNDELSQIPTAVDNAIELLEPQGAPSSLRVRCDSYRPTTTAQAPTGDVRRTRPKPSQLQRPFALF